MNPQETAKGEIVSLVAVAHDAPLVRSDQLLLWRIKRIVAVGNVILPEQLAFLFGSIYAAKAVHPLLKVAQEEVFLRFPALKEKADRIYGRDCFDDAADHCEARNARERQQSLTVQDMVGDTVR